MFRRPDLFSLSLTGIVVLLMQVIPVSAQTHSYRTYDEYTGLPGSYLNVIEQDLNGLLWVGVDTGLYRYDGFTFHHVTLPDTVSRSNATALYCDIKGTIWAGMSDGSLFTWRTGETLERRNLGVTDRISRITGAPDGRVWIVTRTEGIFIGEAGGGDKFTRVSLPGEMTLFDIAFTGDDTFLAATQDNLHLCVRDGERVISEQTFPELEYTWIQSVIRYDDDTWFAGTGGSGLYMIRRRDGQFSASVAGDTAFAYLNITALSAEPGRLLTVATREEGVKTVSVSEDYNTMRVVAAYNITTGLHENNVSTLFRDREGNLWIGLFSKGLAAVTTNAFTFQRPGTNGEIAFIGTLGSESVAGTRNGNYNYDAGKGSFTAFRNITAETGGTGIASRFSDDLGNLWIGTEGAGVWLMKPDGTISRFYQSRNPGQNHVNSVAVENGHIWLGTSDGIVLLDRTSGEQIRVFTTREMMPHNYVTQVVVNRPGEVLAATKSDRLCYVHVTGGVRFEGSVMEGSRVNEIRSISVGPDNTICAGTNGNGLFLFAADTMLNYTEADGLLTNFCYSVLIASDGRIWSGHQKGFTIINPSTGSVRAYSTDFGVRGDCMSNALTELSDGTVCVGTTDGIVAYSPALEKEITIPPQAGIISVVINNVVYPFRDSYNLPYRRSNSLRVNYAGISLSDPLNVIFRTRLDNFDEEWSEETSERSVTYNLSNGHFRFNVEAFTRDDPANATTSSFTLVIQKPVTARWWFILACLIFLSGVVWLIIRLRERAHRKQREYLEGELQKRTAEVYEQKEELLQKNHDITESIKYAKRIQSSMLPDTVRLNSLFREAFIFFQPRDIVSGDFYWFKQIDQDNFIVVCSDCTGHGVPGAFMSMIGTTLLQDIITVKKITRPSQVLHELDRQVISTLNQNKEMEAANDGMDIVVCNFNLSTRQLVFASAMRPVILVIDGEQHYVRGNRASVGGDSVTEKFYDDQEYHLREGDMVYLFTDGYCDQFGGEAGKKMKISRLKEVLEDIFHLPVAQQQKEINDFFFDWMGSNDQVDDVLFMGMRV